MWKKTKAYSENKAIDIIKEILQSEIDSKKYKFFLFGSRAKGDFDNKSDYDIGILWKQEVPHRILLRLKWIFSETPYRVDIIDFFTVDKKFKTLAMENTKTI